MWRLFALGVTLALASPSTEASADDLFHPTPDDQLRELTTDRPHTTETAITVDAGHFQIEMDALRYDVAPATTDIAMGAMLLKLGLDDHLDLQVGIEPLRSIDTRGQDGERELSSGYGDTIVRVKWTVLSIPDRFALGLLPFITHVRGLDIAAPGIGLLFGVPVERGIEIEWMLEVVSRPRESGVQDPVLLATAAATHPVVGDLIAFLEAEASAIRSGVWAGAFRANGGLILPIQNQVQLDAGLRVPIVGIVPFELFVGVSARR